MHLKHKCVCLQKSKSPWQQKLKSAVLEGFVDMTLIKVRLVTLECWLKRHYRHSSQWSTWLCLWASIRGQGDDALCTGEQCSLPFISLALGPRSASSLYSQPLAWGLPRGGFLGTLLKYWLGNLLLVHPQFPDLLLQWSRRNDMRKQSRSNKIKGCSGQSN